MTLLLSCLFRLTKKYNMAKLKVAILHNIIAPYRFKLFNELAKKDIDLTVLFMAEGSKNRKWNPDLYTSEIRFKYKVLPNIKFKLPIKDYTEYIINPTIVFELTKYDRVITAGWLDFSCQMTYLFSKILKYKYIIWSESTLFEDSWQRRLALPYVKWAVKNASGYIAIGSRSKKYLETLGAPANKIEIAYSTVDIEYFADKSRLTLSEINKMKQNIGIPENNNVILYVGQFIPRKNVLSLIKAFSLLKENCSLLLIGYGPEKQSLDEYILKNNVTSVVFLPHHEVSEMPAYYGIADVFVLPSIEETWGLVVNEAMACRLPILASHNAGCVDDLIIEGKTGYCFAPLDYKNLTYLLKSMLHDVTKTKKMREYAHSHITNFSPLRSADSFLNAILDRKKYD